VQPPGRNSRVLGVRCSGLAHRGEEEEDIGSRQQAKSESEMRSRGLARRAVSEWRKALAGNRVRCLNPKSRIRNAKCPNLQSPTANTAFTLFELIAAMAIMLLLASVALPLARIRAQRLRELEMRQDLREIRKAIDHYKDFSDHGMIPIKVDSFGYPPDLDTLVKGVELKGAASAKYKFLRRIPLDPMTGKPDWGMRSVQDDPDSRSWGGQNVFDIYSQSQGTTLDGTRYGDW